MSRRNAVHCRFACKCKTRLAWTRWPQIQRAENQCLCVARHRKAGWRIAHRCSKRISGLVRFPSYKAKSRRFLVCPFGILSCRSHDFKKSTRVTYNRFCGCWTRQYLRILMALIGLQRSGTAIVPSAQSPPSSLSNFNSICVGSSEADAFLLRSQASIQVCRLSSSPYALRSRFSKSGICAAP